MNGHHAHTTMGRSAVEEHDRPRRGFWTLIGILAVTGLAMAVIVIFGLTETKAFGLVGFLFLADLYLVLSLIARHRWLRITLWFGTVITFVLGVVTVFWPEQEYYDQAWDSTVPFEEWTRTTYGLLVDSLYSLHTVFGTLLALGVISLAYRWIAKERLFRLVYVVMFVTAIVAAALWSVGIMLEGVDRLGPYQLGMSILALTAAAIVVIAAFVQRNARVAAERTSVAAEQAVSAHTLGVPQNAEEAAALRALVREYVEEYLAERER